MIERWPIFLLGRNPQKQYGLVSWLSQPSCITPSSYFLEKGVKSHISLDVAIAHDLRLTVAESTWDIPYLNRKISLFHYQILL